MIEPRIPCKICSASILVATANRTGGLCMRCVKQPGWYEREQAFRLRKKSKRLDRNVDPDEITDPQQVITQFESLCYCDGLDQAHPEELIQVLQVLKRCRPSKCAKVISDLLDFIEAGCSPQGHYDEDLVGAFLMGNAAELNQFEESYQAASQVENPAERAAKLT